MAADVGGGGGGFPESGFSVSSLVGRGMGADGHRIIVRDTTKGDPVEVHPTASPAARHVTDFAAAVAAHARRACESRTDVLEEAQQ